MKHAALILLLASVAAAQQKPRVMLAVFAHPDDETVAGPVLARYAREGAKVYLAIATKNLDKLRELSLPEHRRLDVGVCAVDLEVVVVDEVPLEEHVVFRVVRMIGFGIGYETDGVVVEGGVVDPDRIAVRTRVTEHVVV